MRSNTARSPSCAPKGPRLAPPGLPALAQSRGAQLRDDHRLLELRHGAEHLTDEHARRIFVSRRQVGPTVSGNDANAEIPELAEDNLGNEQVARQSISAFRQDESHTVRTDAFYQLTEPVAVVQVTCAADALVAGYSPASSTPWARA
jgi:hypothetical protein